MVGWCGGECCGMFLQQLSMSAHPPIPQCCECVALVPVVVPHGTVQYCVNFTLGKCKCTPSQRQKFFYTTKKLWVSVSEQTGSIPTAHSLKRKVWGLTHNDLKPGHVE